MNFRGTRPLPSKIASNFRRQRSVSSDSFGIGGDPAPAVENRKRFSTAGEGPFSRWEGKMLDLSFPLRGIRQIRDRSFPFLMGPDQKSGPVRNEKNAILDLSFPRRGIRQIRDRSLSGKIKIEDLYFAGNERSSIFSSLSPENSMNFRGTRPLPSKIACDFRRQRSVSSDSRVFFRAMKWLGKNIPPGAPISDRAPAFFYRPMNGSVKKSPWAPIFDRCPRFFIEP